MTLPSLYQIFEVAGKTARRFPLAVLSAYALVILGVIYNHNPYEPLLPYILTGVFAFAIFLAADTFMETEKFKASGRFFGRLLILGLMGAAYYYIFREMQDLVMVDVLKFLVLLVVSRLLVFFAPYMRSDRVNAFWQYTVTLMIRMFQTAVFFGILFLGIVLLLKSVDYLFQISVYEEYYFDIWLVIAGIFASVFFLAGVPANLLRLEQSNNYPKFLRILTEYFLVPLVLLYLLVLYAYSAKILVTWQWPLGGVSSWIMGFSMVGLVAYFLSYSAREKFLSHVEFFKKYFFLLMLPLLLVFGLAIVMRIQAYGWTPDRYYVVEFGVWVLMMSVFYLSTGSRNLKFMVVSLFVLLSFSLYGPQSAFEISRVSQISRLETLLVKNNVLVNGKVLKVADATAISAVDYAEITSMVWYLSEFDWLETLQPWFDEDLSEIGGTDGYYGMADRVFGLMGFGGYLGAGYDVLEDSYAGYGVGNFHSFYAATTTDCEINDICIMDVTGYKYFLPLTVDDIRNTTFDFKDKNYVVEIVNNEVLNFRNTENGEVYLNINLRDFSEYLFNNFQYFKSKVPPDEMTFKFRGGELRITGLEAAFMEGKFSRIKSVYAHLLLK